ncbi:MAG: Hsp20/alpha crystallin family protein [Desulfovibrionaceae bacterium]|nr:Hsp20/alpha crystallin family protein [Desulfovibrionaceae bacterium]MDD4951033.1 Hsp20/alpha crystallin family protein [Desulfovibrionaceae bacterium]
MGKLNWNPWAGLDDLRDQMDRLLEEAIQGVTPTDRLKDKGFMWAPAADVVETGGTLVIQVELPGLGQDEVTLEVKGRELWIAGERPFVREAGEAVYQVLERSYGPFARKFPLAPDADLKNISAVFKNGLLTVTVPRRKRPKKLLDVG